MQRFHEAVSWNVTQKIIIRFLVRSERASKTKAQTIHNKVIPQAGVKVVLNLQPNALYRRSPFNSTVKHPDQRTREIFRHHKREWVTTQKVKPYRRQAFSAYRAKGREREINFSLTVPQAALFSP
ncbi:hypothetical protein TNCV_1723391 [Trichonephila clavipes]|nr:hypothetical protein TNCV_1723391 [Trichonephila clavipes]